MIIEVPKVSVSGSRYEGNEPADCLGLAADRRVRVSAPIRYDLFAERLSTELLVKGEISVDVEMACSRCAEFYSTTVRVLSFLRAYEIKDSTESVDVTPDLREEILMELPVYPVCSSQCRGLCPQCGANLNLGSCGCRPPDGDSRWSQLDRLKG